VQIEINAMPFNTFFDARYGEVIHDRRLAEQIKSNFEKNATGYPIPIFKNHDKTLGKFGEVKEARIRNEGLFLLLDLYEPEKIGRFEYVSPAYAEKYADKSTGEITGPTLLEVSLTNQPGQPGMDKMIFDDIQEATIINTRLKEAQNMDEKLIKKFEDEISDKNETIKKFEEQMKENDLKLKAFSEQMKKQVEEIQSKSTALKTFEEELAVAKKEKFQKEVEIWVNDWIQNKRRPPAIVKGFAEKLMDNADMKTFFDDMLEKVAQIPIGQFVVLEDNRTIDSGKAWEDLGKKMVGGIK